ncbi:MAG: sugar phosphate isomerase/epimerase [Devosia sp.]
MQKLLILQNLWGMDRLRGQADRDLAGNVAHIADGGFDGFSYTWFEREDARRTADPGKAHGLIYEVRSLAHDIDSQKPVLEWGTEFGVHQISIQTQARPRRLGDVVAILEGWQRLAEQVDFAVNIETHRGGMTNDLLVTLDLLEAVPSLRLTADISHYVVGREIGLPVAPETDTQLHEILRHAEAYHGRVASSEQVQVSLSFAHARPWIELFQTWWRFGFADWRARSGPDAKPTFLCELGPQPYAIAGADGEELTDRWEESLLLRDLARTCW